MSTVQKIDALQCVGLRKVFGGIAAVDDVSLSVPFNQITGLIGPNGSGKSTLVDMLSGVLKPNSGKVLLGEVNITGLTPYKISRLGLGRTFQIAKNFLEMSVIDNLVVANPDGVSKEAIERSESVLATLNLTKLRNERARSLSFGQQKLLGVGRIMMRNPKVIILDEPFSGINPVIQEKMVSLLLKFKESTAILLIEHDMKVISNLCDRVIAMDRGKVIATGKPEDVLRDAKVVEAYLGGK
jgi:branched-chain amino acid transport system ATP-binding protein